MKKMIELIIERGQKEGSSVQNVIASAINDADVEEGEVLGNTRQVKMARAFLCRFAFASRTFMMMLSRSNLLTRRRPKVQDVTQQQLPR